MSRTVYRFEDTATPQSCLQEVSGPARRLDLSALAWQARPGRIAYEGLCILCRRGRRLMPSRRSGRRSSTDSGEAARF